MKLNSLFCLGGEAISISKIADHFGFWIILVDLEEKFSYFEDNFNGNGDISEAFINNTSLDEDSDWIDAGIYISDIGDFVGVLVCPKSELSRQLFNMIQELEGKNE